MSRFAEQVLLQLLLAVLLAACVETKSCPSGFGREGRQCIELADAQVDSGDSGDSAVDAPMPCGGCSGETPICEVVRNRCVQCLSDAECAGTACDLATGRCTGVAVGTLDVCRTCRATSECAIGHVCVNQFADGMYVGDYCMPTSCAARLYTSQSPARAVDGSAVNICGFAIPSSSCAALGSFENRVDCTVGGANACGAFGVSDGACSAGRCTLSCLTSNGNCPIGSECNGAGLCESP